MKIVNAGHAILFGATLLSMVGAAQPAAAQSAGIAAVVNGQVITTEDVANRAKLLALSAGMHPTPDILSRLQPQITQQLIDQTLQLQEINKRNVVVPEDQIATDIQHIEQGNGLPPGGLKARMEQGGIGFSTLVQQIRTQIGWQMVLHQVLGPGLQPTPGDMRAEKAALKAEIGTTQYHISEIFIPVSDPANDKTAEDFANTVIGQLRQGAPFSVVAAQFSQAENALQGGDKGFVSLGELDPSVAAIVTQMPTGAVSNPIRVPGGYDIVQMQGTHQVGTSTATSLDIRQVFAPYPSPITNGRVGPDQAAVIAKLVAGAKSVHDCTGMDNLNSQFGNARQDNPGPVDLASVSPPAFQQILASLALNTVSQPLVAQDGVSVVMVCARNTKNVGLPADDQISELIIERRVELESQQLLDSLRNQSVITQD